MNSIKGFGVCIALLAILPLSIHAQTCRAASDSASLRLVEWVDNQTNPTDAVEDSYRVAMGYPLLPRSQVSVVTHNATCNKALAAYQAAGAGGAGFTGRVAVVKAGNTYTVYDPGYYYGPAPKVGDFYVQLDSRFKVINKFGV